MTHPFIHTYTHTWFGMLSMIMILVFTGGFYVVIYMDTRNYSPFELRGAKAKEKEKMKLPKHDISI